MSLSTTLDDVPIEEATSPAAGWILYSLKKPHITFPMAEMAKPYTWRWMRNSGCTVPSGLFALALAYIRSESLPMMIEKTSSETPASRCQILHPTIDGDFDLRLTHTGREVRVSDLSCGPSVSSLPHGWKCHVHCVQTSEKQGTVNADDQTWDVIQRLYQSVRCWLGGLRELLLVDQCFLSKLWPNKVSLALGIHLAVADETSQCLWDKERQDEQYREACYS